jgi:uncharacterized repeat protein (TIGR03803 family)
MSKLKSITKVLRATLLGASAAAALLAQTPPWQLTTLTSFVPIGDGAGEHPLSGVAAGKNGDIYGTTTLTGFGAGYGVVYQLVPPASPGGAWTENPRYTFEDIEGTGLVGMAPVGGLVIGDNGVFYGTTSESLSGYGIVFSLTPTPGDYSWPIRVLHTFAGGADGASPQSTMAIGKGGVLYGTTFYGGTGKCVNYELPAGCGTVFSLTPPESPGGDWTEAVLYSFTGGSDGAQPSGVTLNSDGVVYGTTLIHGTRRGCLGPGCGTVFSLTPPASPGGSWAQNTLYRFTGPPHDGGRPQAGVAIGGGVLYGTCSLGGQSEGNFASFGTVFSLTPPAGDSSGLWSETILYNFLGPDEGIGIPGIPMGLTLAANGVLYGVTQSGGPEGEGTVFSLTPPAVLGKPWTHQVLHDFTGGDDGGVPVGSLIIGDGVLYGTSSQGGSELAGTVFQLKP